MKFQIYILGFLLRHGKQHGYNLAKLIKKEVSFFVDINQSTIYYHLEKLEIKGFVDSKKEKNGKRPDKFIYSITEKGEKEFTRITEKMYKSEYTPEFDFDSALYFTDIDKKHDLVRALNDKKEKLETKISKLSSLLEEAKESIEEEKKDMIDAIYEHRLMHFNAELEWTNKTLSKLHKKPVLIWGGFSD